MRVIGAQPGSIFWWGEFIGNQRPTQDLYAQARLRMMNEQAGAAEFVREPPDLADAQMVWDHVNPEPKRKVGWVRLRFQVLTRDGFKCRYCGQAAPHVELQVDHVHPRSKGGEDTLDNLVASCRECNLGKRDVLLPALVEVQ